MLVAIAEAHPDNVQNVDLWDEKHFSHLLFLDLGVGFDLHGTEMPAQLFALFPPISHSVKPPF